MTGRGAKARPKTCSPPRSALAERGVLGPEAHDDVTATIGINANPSERAVMAQNLRWLLGRLGRRALCGTLTDTLYTCSPFRVASGAKNQADPAGPRCASSPIYPQSGREKPVWNATP